MQIIGVNFKDRNSDAYQDKVYNYNCDISDVAVGDILIAPTSSKDGDAIVRVCTVGVAPETVSPDIRAILKTITRRADEVVEVIPASDSTDIITIQQLPVITERLYSIKAAVLAKVAAILAMPCNEDTVKEIKKARADLNRDFKDLEARRKYVKAEILKPYEAFEAVYRECATDLFTAADNQLRDAIGGVEGAIKENMRLIIVSFYERELESFGLDFPVFERSAIKIGLSDSENALKKQVKEFVHRIHEDVEMIKLLPLADEVLVEYKEFLNAPRAISAVNARHKALEEVREKMDVAPAASAFVPPPPPEVPHIVVQTKADDEKTITIQITGNQRQIDNLLKFLGDSWYTFKVIG